MIRLDILHYNTTIGMDAQRPREIFLNAIYPSFVIPNGSDHAVVKSCLLGARW